MSKREFKYGGCVQGKGLVMFHTFKVLWASALFDAEIMYPGVKNKLVLYFNEWVYSETKDIDQINKMREKISFASGGKKVDFSAQILYDGKLFQEAKVYEF